MIDIASGEVEDREPTPEEQGRTRTRSPSAARAVREAARHAAAQLTPTAQYRAQGRMVTNFLTGT